MKSFDFRIVENIVDNNASESNDIYWIELTWTELFIMCLMLNVNGVNKFFCYPKNVTNSSIEFVAWFI